MNGLVAPGSALWLLAHELRLGWRGVWSSPAMKKRRWLFAILALGLAALAFSVGIPLAMLLRRVAVEPSPLLYAGLTLGMAVLGALMIAQGLNGATLTLYERRDLDLLLSSPVPARRVLTVRALAVATGAVALFVVLATPLVVSLALVGDPRWLALYPVLFSMALAATAIGFAIAMGLFALVGARTTRVIAQVLAALIGASFFLLSQIGNLAPRGQVRSRVWLEQARTAAESPLFAADGLLSWPARAVLGEPLPLLLFTAAGALVFLATTALLGRRFAADAAAAAGAGPSRRKAGLGTAPLAGFGGGGVTRLLIAKELKLLARDPFLVSQVLMQILFLVPLVFVIWRNALGSADITAAAGASGLVFITTQLVGNLAWITVSAEDAPELIAASPLPKREADRAKAIAAILPVAALMTVPLAGLAALSPWAAVAALLGCAAAAVSSTLVNIWHQKPGKRSDFRRSRRASWLVSLAEVGLAFAWSSAAALLALLQPWWLIPACIGAGVLVLLRKPAPAA